MKKADTERIQKLCSLIAVEQDRHRFLSLVEELNQFLAAKNKDKDDGPLSKKPDNPAGE